MKRHDFLPDSLFEGIFLIVCGILFWKIKGQGTASVKKQDLRSFIAIELSEDIRKKLARIKDDFKKSGADIRWVKRQNIHLTLKFLGDIKEDKAEKIADALKEVCSRYSPFNIEISGAGVFPNLRSPRVLWAGVQDSETLTSMFNDLDRELSHIGFEREARPFRPHLTVGRFRSAREKKALKEQIDNLSEMSLGHMEVKSLSFIKSELSQEGAQYSTIAEVMLSDNIN